MSQATPPPTSHHSLDQLLKLGSDAARNGNRQAARALFLALAREHPDDPRVWIGIVGVAASRNEQREALARVVALDPDNQRARLALERLLDTSASTDLALDLAPIPGTTSTLPTPEPAPHARVPVATTAPPDDEPQQQTPFPLLNLIAMGLILLLLVALGVILGRALLGGTSTAAAPTATPALSLQLGAAATAPLEPAAPTAPLAAAATSAPLPAAPSPISPLALTQAATAPAQATPAAPDATADPVPPGIAPTPGPPLTLPMGTPLDVDGWTAVLVRPDYAVPLDGAIGDLQPAGRFVLAVVAVSNNSPTPRAIPPDLFVLLDSAGRTYLPVPGASSAYLALYERAQRGDLALEDVFEPVVGLRSVPVIFDVLPDATGLRLTVRGAGPAGWPVGESLPASSPIGP